MALQPAELHQLLWLQEPWRQPTVSNESSRFSKEIDSPPALSLSLELRLCRGVVVAGVSFTKIQHLVHYEVTVVATLGNLREDC